MVWEQQANLIVMVTNEVEGGKLKCHRYWPNAEDPKVSMWLLLLLLLLFVVVVVVVVFVWLLFLSLLSSRVFFNIYSSSSSFFFLSLFLPFPPLKALQFSLFPLLGECKDLMTKFMSCLKVNNHNGRACRDEAKVYLNCRMEK